MMWFSFGTNIFTFLVGVFLYYTWCRHTHQSFYNQFVILTGVSAGIAAFGHLELLPIYWQKSLLVVSRIVNVLAIYSFATHSLKHFGYYKNLWVRNAHIASGLLGLFWLLILNLNAPGSKAAFLPVIVYGLVGMVLIGMLSYCLNLKADFSSYSSVVLGVLLILVSAVIFKVIPEGTGVKPSDISHILIAIGLAVMTFGVKRNKQNEIKK